MPMPRLEPQRTIEYQAEKQLGQSDPIELDTPDDDSESCPIPAVKPPRKKQDRSHIRKPSARAPWEQREIPIMLQSVKGRYRVRNRALFACEFRWGLRAHEILDVRMGDILLLAPDGSYTWRDGFTMEGARLKGGKERKPWVPKPSPKGHGKACPCNLCNQHEPKRSAPEIRYLTIMPDLITYLTPWLEEVQQRVGKLTPDLYLWLSRKRAKDGSWRQLTRQSFWFITTQACKVAEPLINDPTFTWMDYGSHSFRKSVATAFPKLEDAQHYLGHKSSATTDKYRKANPRKQRQLALELAAMLPLTAAVAA